MTDNLFSSVRGVVVAALAAAIPDLPPEVLARVEVTPTKDAAHGDMATNAAMVASKAARMKPQDIAAKLVAALAGHGDIEKAEAAGPGFVNLTLLPDTMRAQIPVGLAHFVECPVKRIISVKRIQFH